MRQRQVRAVARHGQEASEIVKRLRSIQSGSGHNLARIWDDWISSMALAIANGCDRRPQVWREREDEYMQIVARHGRETMHAFAEMLALLVQGLDCELPTDLLGSIYMALELGNNHAGQFFTPSSVCELLARMTLTPAGIREIIEREGFITVHEPAIGGGATVIPVVAAVREAGYSPSAHLHVVGIDVDWTVLRMAYVQLSLLGVPAILYVGDTLRGELREAWFSPAHILAGWSAKLARRAAIAGAKQLLEEANNQHESKDAEVAYEARDLFFAVGTDDSRRTDWRLWHEAEPGAQLVIATLDHVFEATVVERPRATEPETEVMVVEISGRKRTLRMTRASSAGYYDHHPDKRFPGCDRDVDLDGLSARLVEFRQVLTDAPHPSALAGCSTLLDVIETLADYGLEPGAVRAYVLEHAAAIPVAVQLRGLDRRLDRLLAAL